MKVMWRSLKRNLEQSQKSSVRQRSPFRLVYHTANTLFLRSEGTLQTTRVFGEENYDALSTKTAVHSAKLLKKHDQCRAVYMCSHLFWKTGTEVLQNVPLTPSKERAIVHHAPILQGEDDHKEGKRVLECLQKSLRIADACMDSSTNVKLFVEILNEYLYYFEAKNEAVILSFIC